MTDQPSQPVAIPWYQSKVIQGLIVTLATQAIADFHLGAKLTADEIGSYVDTTFQIISVIAVAWSGYHRVTKPNPTVVSSQVKANAINQPPSV